MYNSSLCRSVKYGVIFKKVSESILKHKYDSNIHIWHYRISIQLIMDKINFKIQHFNNLIRNFFFSLFTLAEFFILRYIKYEKNVLDLVKKINSPISFTLKTPRKPDQYIGTENSAFTSVGETFVHSFFPTFTPDDIILFTIFY